MTTYLHITVFNILVLVFVSFAWTRVFFRFRSAAISLKWFVFWTVTWFGLLAIIFLPGKADFVARILGVNNSPDALLTVAVVFLLYTAYRLYVKIDTVEEEISRLTRFIALQPNRKKINKPL